MAKGKGKKGKQGKKGEGKPTAPKLTPGHFFTGSSLLAVLLWPNASTCARLPTPLCARPRAHHTLALFVVSPCPPVPPGAAERERGREKDKRKEAPRRC